MKSTLLSILMVILLLGCGGQASVSNETCDDQTPCRDGRICVEGACLDLDDDPDWDGLSTRLENQAGSSPLAWDTDGDGRGDGEEWGKSDDPMDMDGDGLPDLVESFEADGDGDCIPDQLDPTDGPAPEDQAIARELLCRNLGECAQVWDSISITCPEGQALCTMPDGTPVPQVETACDGLDNDCDGEVDEGITLGTIPLGDPCTAAGNCGAGHVECSPATLMPICSSAPGGSEDASSKELCNGQDDDCNGRIDDGLLLGDSPVGGTCLAPGLCGLGIVECDPVSQGLRCSTGRGGSQDASSDEVCDGKDNDCDGGTDEDLFEVPSVACPTKGICLEKQELFTSVCVSGTWICKVGVDSGFEPSRELSCDGLDNDCDGEVDEDFSFKDWDMSQRHRGDSCGTGACAGGEVICNSLGTGLTCSTLELAGPESCNSKDDDCDGLPDQGLLYNGKALGEACTGKGTCGLGVVECVPATGQVTCSSNADGSESRAMEETCDMADNDCDGQVDESPRIPDDVCPNKGVCLQGLEGLAHCVEGKWVCEFDDLPLYEMVETLCDSRDNDCDGQVDEGLAKKFSNAWDLLSPPGPHPVLHPSLARAGANSPWLLFGGMGMQPLDGGEPVSSSTLWAMDVSGEWDELAGLELQPRGQATMAFLPYLGSYLIVGGTDNSGEILDAWLITPDSWEAQLVELPEVVRDRMGHTALVSPDTGELWLIGGTTQAGAVAPSLRLGPDLQTITPIAGFDHAGVAISALCPTLSQALVLTSEDRLQPLAGAWVVDFADQSITPAAQEDLGPRVSDPGLACHQGLVYLLGGRKVDGTLSSGLWQWDFEQTAWNLLQDQGPALRSPLLLSAGGNLLLSGGFDAQWRAQTSTMFLSQEDPSWTPLTSARPRPRAMASTGVLPNQGRFCIYGGVAAAPDWPLWLHDLWCFSQQDEEWEQLPVVDGPDMVGATMDLDPLLQRFLFLGGCSRDEGGFPDCQVPECRFWELNLATSTWTNLANCQAGATPPYFRSGHSTAVRWSDATLWLFGGRTPDGDSGELWRYSLETGEWSQILLTPAVQPRYGARIFVMDDGALLLVSGEGSGGGIDIIHTETGQVSRIASVPWTAVSDPVAAYDAQSRSLLISTGTKAGNFSISEDGLESMETWTPDLCQGLVGQSNAFLAGVRAGFAFGGMDANGSVTSSFCELPTECSN